MSNARTVKELKDGGWQRKSVKQELRDNLVARLRRGEAFLPGIVGYEETVVPQIENAILCGQDIIFLGERGQAKTRIARLLVGLLDEEIPALAGCEINDDPLAPDLPGVPRAGRRAGRRGGRSCWIPRDRRYGEKLATPDITIADLIGEVDPIKVAEGRYLSDELTIHYGCCRAPTAASSRSTSCRTWPSASRSACSTSWRSATSRSAATRSGCRSTSSWSPAPTPRTTPTAAASSRR